MKIYGQKNYRQNIVIIAYLNGTNRSVTPSLEVTTLYRGCHCLLDSLTLYQIKFEKFDRIDVLDLDMLST